MSGDDFNRSTASPKNIETEIWRQLDRLAITTENQQKQIEELVKVTGEQSKMTNTLVNQMKPILQREKDKHELNRAVLDKLVTGGIWGTVCACGMLFWFWLKHTFMKGN